jgi:superkiller protein 3
MPPATRTGRLGAAALLLVMTLGTACGGGTAKPADPAADALARGIAAQTANRLDEATKDYFEVLFNDPKNKVAFYLLGQIALFQNRLAIAEGYYRSAIEIDPKYGAALLGLGRVRASLGAIPEAIDWYRQVIAVEPDNAFAHYNLGNLLRLQGKIAEGDAEIAKGIQLDPKLPPPSPIPTPTPKPATPTPTR